MIHLDVHRSRLLPAVHGHTVADSLRDHEPGRAGRYGWIVRREVTEAIHQQARQPGALAAEHTAPPSREEIADGPDMVGRTLKRTPAQDQPPRLQGARQSGT